MRRARLASGRSASCKTSVSHKPAPCLLNWPYQCRLNFVTSPAYEFLFCRSIYLMTTPSSTVRSGTQTILSILLLTFWSYASGKLKRSDRQAERPEEHERLQQAIPIAGKTGVSEAWYDMATMLTRFISSARALLSVAFLLLLLLWAYPAGPGVDPQQMLSEYLNARWKALTEAYTDEQIFVWGKFAAFVLPYYGLALVGALLDFACPAVLVPFKIQEDSWPTLADYAKCTPLVLLNTALLVPLLYMTYPVYRHFATDPFGELPPLWTVILQVPVFISTAEIVFYFPHRWMCSLRRYSERLPCSDAPCCEAPPPDQLPPLASAGTLPGHSSTFITSITSTRRRSPSPQYSSAAASTHAPTASRCPTSAPTGPAASICLHLPHLPPLPPPAALPIDCSPPELSSRAARRSTRTRPSSPDCFWLLLIASVILQVYSHPAEFALSNVLPFVLGPILCGAHMVTWLIWTVFGVASGSIGHMGFQLPFLGKRQGHDWHHRETHLGMYDLIALDCA